VTCPSAGNQRLRVLYLYKISQYSVQNIQLDVSKLVAHLEIAPHSGVAIATSLVIPSASHLFLLFLRPRFLLLFLPGPPLLFSLRFLFFSNPPVVFPLLDSISSAPIPFFLFAFPMLRRFCPSSFLFGLDCCSFRYVLHPAPLQKPEKDYSGFIVLKANVIVNFFFLRDRTLR